MKSTILIVDDEAGVRSALSGVLRDEGYTVDAVDSGEACLDRVARAPFDVIVLDNAVRQRRLEAENRALRAHVDRRLTMVGESYAMTRLREQIAMAAPTNGRVLIYGENGTGKELVARSIHSLSRRRHAAFVEVNCAAIPEELIESELF